MAIAPLIEALSGNGQPLPDFEIERSRCNIVCCSSYKKKAFQRRRILYQTVGEKRNLSLEKSSCFKNLAQQLCYCCRSNKAKQDELSKNREARQVFIDQLYKTQGVAGAVALRSYAQYNNLTLLEQNNTFFYNRTHMESPFTIREIKEIEGEVIESKKALLNHHFYQTLSAQKSTDITFEYISDTFRKDSEESRDRTPPRRYIFGHSSQNEGLGVALNFLRPLVQRAYLAPPTRPPSNGGSSPMNPALTASSSRDEDICSFEDMLKSSSQSKKGRKAQIIEKGTLSLSPETETFVRRTPIDSPQRVLPAPRSSPPLYDEGEPLIDHIVAQERVWLQIVAPQSLQKIIEAVPKGLNPAQCLELYDAIVAGEVHCEKKQVYLC